MVLLEMGLFDKKELSDIWQVLSPADILRVFKDI
jgi:hypothetical protein